MQSLIGAVLFPFILLQDSHAYLNPGSGSLILQLVLAGLFAVSLMTRIFWGKIKTFFTRRSSTAPAENKERDEDADA